MNGVHDLGGMHGFGPVIPEANEPVFHADWERRTFALAVATMADRRVNVDEFRRTVERMEPAHYLASSYYEHWLHAVEAMLVEKGFLAAGEIDAAMQERRIEAASATPSPVTMDVDRGPQTEPDKSAELPRSVALRRDPKFKARYKVGETVIVRNLNPTTHTRVPRYVRGHRGVIRHDWGTFIFPDTYAHGMGANPQHCYGVEFTARELWGRDHPGGERLHIDLWESYLDAAVPSRASRKESPARPIKRMGIAKSPTLKTKAKGTPTRARLAKSRSHGKTGAPVRSSRKKR